MYARLSFFACFFSHLHLISNNQSKFEVQAKIELLGSLIGTAFHLGPDEAGLTYL